MDRNTRKGCFIFEKNVSSLLDQYISLTLDTRIFIHSVYGIIRIYYDATYDWKEINGKEKVIINKNLNILQTNILRFPVFRVRKYWICQN